MLYGGKDADMFMSDSDKTNAKNKENILGQMISGGKCHVAGGLSYSY